MSGASHSKHSKPGRSRVRNRFPRRVGFKPPLPVVVVVCDDSATAPAYFELLKRDVKASVTLNVVRAPRHGASPNDVVEIAVNQKANLTSGEKKNDAEPGDAVWALFDTEHKPHDRQRAKEAKEKANRENINVAVSDPCYEVWTLLHLEDAGQPFADCQAVIKQVKNAWKKKFNQPFGPKAQAKYDKILPFRHEAVERAKKHHNAGNSSTTEVYKLIEHIESIVQQQDT